MEAFKVLKKPYLLSVWKDELLENGMVVETPIANIGQDNSQSQCYARDVKFKQKLDGANELTFKMYKKFIDNSTGLETYNPLIDLVPNESKLKLKYGEKWYDFIVKNVVQDSSDLSYTYQATDFHVNELAKNGYDLVLDTELMNNTGTAVELGGEVLKSTSWGIAGDVLVQKVEEPLAEMRTINTNSLVLVPYSSLKNQPQKFQYFTTLSSEDGVIKTGEEVFEVTEATPYTTDAGASVYGFTYPLGWKFVGLSKLRGMRTVYTHQSKYNPALNKIVYYYSSPEGYRVAGYTETEYVTPNLIQNLVTNSTFKTVDGWRGTRWYAELGPGGIVDENKEKPYATVEAKTSPDLIEALKKGEFNEATVYEPYLHIKFNHDNHCVVNSGFYDNRKIIKNLAPQQKFVLFYKELDNSEAPFQVKIGAVSYDIASNSYHPPEQFLLSFNSVDSKEYGEVDGYSGYRYVIGRVAKEYKLNEDAFQKLKTLIYITGQNGVEYNFKDFQIFPYYQKEAASEVPILPTNQPAEAKTFTKYSYYLVDDNPELSTAEGYKATAAEYSYLAQQYAPALQYQPWVTTEKIRSINVKQSNYFNAIQSICETFECWAELQIEHDEDGYILGKSIYLHEYIGNKNNFGIRYGVNLKSVKRTLDSKQVVSKLIVPDSINELAKNGFCSIARSGANPSGENCIYNFEYYVLQKLIKKEVLEKVLYGPTGSEGFYPKMLAINSRLTSVIDKFSALSKPLMEAQAAMQLAEAGAAAASSSYEEAADSFFKMAGFEHTDVLSDELSEEEQEARNDRIDKDPALGKYLSEIAEYSIAQTHYKKEFEAAKKLYDGYKKQSDAYNAEIISLTKTKKAANADFFQKMYRYIQEGTWKSDEYNDNDKYYIDALNTSYNSCLPKVSYTFNIVDVSHFENYQNLSFELADQTWVEDPEIFGEGYREDVVITEITHTLDEPNKSTFKAQNYKNQFADLFQKQLATVQQVEFAKGNWNFATHFSEASSSNQATFLQDALKDAELILQNAGEQTVVWDKDGITVTDLDTPSQQIRIVGGAILLRDEDADGLGWKTGITSKGISAKLITTGQLNVGAIQIMNGNEPYFRWDANGITAYDFQLAGKDHKYKYKVNTKKGVRFDRMGIYGFTNPGDKSGKKAIDGALWHPDSIEEIKQYCQFALTWDGLFINLGYAYYDEYYTYDKEKDQIKSVDEEGNYLKLEKPLWHGGTAAIGKTSKKIFNKWITDIESPYFGLPYYDPDDKEAAVFAKIFSVGGADGNDELAIYDDGTLVARRVKLVEEVQYTKNTSPSKTVYARFTIKDPPPPNTPYSSFPENDGDGTEENPFVWHTKSNEKDMVYAHTDDAGATWQGPFLITGRSIIGTETHYAFAKKGTKPENIPEEAWLRDFPEVSIPGLCIYTRTRDVYNNGEVSEWRYSVGLIGPGPVMLEIYTNTGSLYIGEQISADLTVRVSQENLDITENFDDENFIWEKYDKHGEKDRNWYRYGKTIYISNADVYHKATFNCILTIEDKEEE